PTPPILCLRFAVSLAVAAQDSRPSGSLLLSRKALASSTSYRFIPAHINRDYTTNPCKCSARTQLATPPRFPHCPNPCFFSYLLSSGHVTVQSVNFAPATSSLPHDIFLQHFCAIQEPPSERTRRTPLVRLRTPPFPRVVLLFPARSLAEQ